MIESPAVSEAISAEPLLRLLIGFEASQVLMTAHELRIFETLDSKSFSPEELCTALGLPIESGRRLLESCVAFHLLVWDDARLKNSALAAAYLVPQSGRYLGGLVSYYQDFYSACSALPQAVRENRPQVKEAAGTVTDVFSAMEKKEALVVRFSEAMHSLGLNEGSSLASLYPFEKIRHLLDIGGGSGALAIALANRYPELNLTIFDRGGVCRLAQSYISAAGYSERIGTQSGDFWTDAFPKNADAILLSMILHDWSADEGLSLLKRCFETLPSGGIVLIYEQLLDDDRCGPPLACLTNLTMLLRTRSGRESTEQDYHGLLARAGFVSIETRRSPRLRHLIHAAKP